jgi:hypothetical protein
MKNLHVRCLRSRLRRWVSPSTRGWQHIRGTPLVSLKLRLRPWNRSRLLPPQPLAQSLNSLPQSNRLRCQLRLGKLKDKYWAGSLLEVPLEIALTKRISLLLQRKQLFYQWVRSLLQGIKVLSMRTVSVSLLQQSSPARQGLNLEITRVLMPLPQAKLMGLRVKCSLRRILRSLLLSKQP